MNYVSLSIRMALSRILIDRCTTYFYCGYIYPTKTTNIVLFFRIVLFFLFLFFDVVGRYNCTAWLCCSFLYSFGFFIGSREVFSASWKIPTLDRLKSRFRVIFGAVCPSIESLKPIFKMLSISRPRYECMAGRQAGGQCVSTVWREREREREKVEGFRKGLLSFVQSHVHVKFVCANMAWNREIRPFYAFADLRFVCALKQWKGTEILIGNSKAMTAIVSGVLK